MCNAGAAAASLIGGQMGLDFYASEQQIEGIKKVARYNAAQLEQKALRVQQVEGERQADAATRAGKVRAKGDQVRGAGQAGFAAANVIVASGSSLDWASGLEGNVRQDMQQIGINLERELRTLAQTRDDLLSAAEFERWKGETGVQAQRIQQVGIPLQAGTQAASMFI